MKWFKHDSDANMDSKLQEILLDYGLEGYGLYWYCLEMIVNKIDYDNLTFELEHDARIIARNTGSTPKKVVEMMKRFVELGLFQNSDGRVTCLKLLSRLDKSMTSNAKFRDAIDVAKRSHDPIMIKPDLVMQEEKRIQEITIEENKKDSKQDEIYSRIINEDILIEFNKVVSNKKPNWSSVSILNKSRMSRCKKLIDFTKKRIKESNLSETPVQYIARLFEGMATDDFYCGKQPSSKYPNGYKWDFDTLTTEKHVIKFIEKQIDTGYKKVESGFDIDFMDVELYEDKYS